VGLDDLVIEGELHAEHALSALKGRRVRLPASPRELLERVCAWFEERGDVCALDVRPGIRATPEACVRLHPMCPGIRVIAQDHNYLRVEGETLRVGPGYRVYAGRVLEALGDALGVAWAQPPNLAPAAALALARASLAEHAQRCLRSLSSGQSVGLLVQDGVEFSTGRGRVATPLGPRDHAWLVEAAQRRLRVLDAFPWPGAGVGHSSFLGRALSLMWTEVRWRDPQDNAERRVLADVDARLSQAWMINPRVPLPWVEWAEIQRMLHIAGPLADEVASRAAVAPPRPLVGYRHRDVRLRLTRGWWVRLPGSMGALEAGDDGWEGHEPGRRVTLAILGPGQRPASLSPAPGTVCLRQRDGPAEGEATLSEPFPGRFVLNGQVSVGESWAVIIARYERRTDHDWAERAWRSLRIRSRLPS